MKRSILAGALALILATGAHAQVGQIVAGKDSGNTARTFLTDNTGRLLIVGSGVGGVVYGADADGAAPTQAPVAVAGYATTGAHACVNGRICYLNFDTTGNLRVTPSGTATVTGTVAATQSGTWNIGSVTTLPSIPAGANVIGGVTQSGTWNINNVSGTISLPTGAATSAAQTTAQTSLSAITTSTANTDTNTASLVTKATGPTAGTISSVACSASSQTLIASNASRRGLVVYGDGNADAYVAMTSSAATTSAYTIKIAASGYWEAPFNYTGAMTVICSAATGNLRVTSLQ